MNDDAHNPSDASSKRDSARWLLEFRDSWQQGTRVRVEEFIDKVPAEERRTILRELLTLEIQLRRSSGELPQPDEYQQRFPQDSDVVMQVFSTNRTTDPQAESLEPTQFVSKPPTATSDQVPTSGASGFDAFPDNSLTVPRQIGRFTVSQVLGRGAFGVVYLAHDSQLERDVALKIPRADRFDSAKDTERFIQEARNAAKLSHPGIVQVHDVGVHAEAPYIVQQFVDGGSLAQRMKVGLVPPHTVADLMIAIADAVAYAHERGFVHRDLKPDNILLDSSGQPHVADFGLALHETVQRRRRGEQSGTPAYMSPEQIRGLTHQLDGRSDIWSLGCILYELLAGCRPFWGGDRGELFEQILNRDPRPIRQLNRSIPEELERICRCCLRKRMIDRYPTADDLARELRDWRERRNSAADDAGQAASLQEAPLVPQGLRAFNEGDADFFLRLVPGPRDREGLPESIRFWKSQIEERFPERTFRVAVMYGPSGCGKSSLVKAGLLPRIASRVTSLYVEATRDDTDVRLLHSLRRCYPQLDEQMDLAETAAVLRAQVEITAGRKTLIVLDQFEQWLHAGRALATDPLVEALRHCDGEHLQCLLLVRDDFWMSITRFMQELETPLVERGNSMAVDLFDRDHARRVLAEFGHAFGRISEEGYSVQEEQFLEEAVAGLAEDDKVVCVRLALFAEMMKSRPWTPNSLRAVGGADGVGVAFLEQTFSSSTAPPACRFHQRAARAVLQALLPERTAHIKGQTCSYNELQEVSGYAGREHEFRDLIDILDTQLRLITPTESIEPVAGPDTVPTTREPTYQLTHDYLVSSLRKWLNRKQKETYRGRAELRLQERTEIWRTTRERRHLPSGWEDVNIRLFTSRKNWSSEQATMMRKSLSWHGIQLSALIVLVAIASVVTVSARRTLDDRQNREIAHTLVDSLMTAEISQVPDVVAEIDSKRQWAEPFLIFENEKADDDSSAKLHTALALVAKDPNQLSYIQRRLLRAQPDQVSTICQMLVPYRRQLEAGLWDVLQQADTHPGGERLRAAAALAAFDPANTRWQTLSGDVAARLVDVPTTQLSDWIHMLRPVKKLLVPHLVAVYRDRGRSAADRKLVTDALADYVAGESPLLVDLVTDADPQQFVVLLDPLRADAQAALPLLRERLNRPLKIPWPERDVERPPPSPETVAAMEQACGLVAPDFAFCQTLDVAAVERWIESLGEAGYRLTHLRPYTTAEGVRIAAVWLRDGRECRWLFDCSADELRDRNRELAGAGFVPADIAAYHDSSTQDGPPAQRFAAVWAKDSPAIIDWEMFERMRADLYLAVPEDQHSSAWGPLNHAGFVPRTNCKTWGADGASFYSSLRWKLRVNPVYRDCWDLGLSEYERMRPASWFQADVRLTGGSPSDVGPRLAGVWWNGVGYESQEIHAVTPVVQRERSITLAQSDFRPSSISVISDPSAGDLIAASTWYRPVTPAAQREAWVRQKGNAAVALLHVDDDSSAWRLLVHDSDPRVRTYLIQNLCDLGVDPLQLLRQFSQHTDVSAQRALVLAVAACDPTRVPTVERENILREVVEVTTMRQDPGLRSALELLSGRWNMPLESLDDAPAGTPDTRGWYRTQEGHVMAILDPPSEVQTGTPGYEEDRDHYREIQRAVRLGYRYSISTTEVTVKQFLRFAPRYDYAAKFSPEESCPVNMVTWYEAAQYCNWLSEREGVAPQQWCFPKDIEQGMQLPADYLERTGYRLPTEAEWEFACRANATTSRFYGDSVETLDAFAWTVVNSRNRTWPVALLMPNDFGLFDSLGNVMEWCLPLHDITNTGPEVPAGEITDAMSCVARGGGYDFQPSSARCGYRYVSVPAERQPYVGFRVVRTVP